MDRTRLPPAGCLPELPFACPTLCTHGSACVRQLPMRTLPSGPSGALPCLEERKPLWHRTINAMRPQHLLPAMVVPVLQLHATSNCPGRNKMRTAATGALPCVQLRLSLAAFHAIECCWCEPLVYMKGSPVLGVGALAFELRRRFMQGSCSAVNSLQRGLPCCEWRAHTERSRSGAAASCRLPWCKAEAVHSDGQLALLRD